MEELNGLALCTRQYIKTLLSNGKECGSCCRMLILTTCKDFMKLSLIGTEPTMGRDQLPINEALCVG